MVNNADLVNVVLSVLKYLLSWALTTSGISLKEYQASVCIC